MFYTNTDIYHSLLKIGNKINLIKNITVRKKETKVVSIQITCPRIIFFFRKTSKQIMFARELEKAAGSLNQSM